MKKNSYLRRHFREGINNFKRNGWMTVTSVSSLAFMLFLVGLTSLLSINLSNMTAKVEKNVEIRVYLDDTSSTELSNLWKRIKSYEQVSSIEFISKEEGLKSFMKNLGDEGTAFRTLKKDNPLNDELVVRTKNPRDVTAVAKRIEKLTHVDKVEYAKNIVGPLLTTTKLARFIGVLFIVCLTLIAVHLVTNTIKVTVLARTEEIKLRKLIGATNLFIRLPFFIEGSLIGLLGAAIADTLIILGYCLLYNYFHMYIHISLIEMLAPIPLIPIFCLVLLIFGCLIGIWGALASLRRILKV